jgi:hypothetical protein
MKKTISSCVVRTALLACLLLATGLTGGCSTFNRDFEAASELAPADAMSGAWTGSWQSDYNGHNGKLRAIITQRDDTEAPAEIRPYYEARYHAVYAGFLTFEYTTKLYPQQSADGKTAFEGAEDLGYAKEGVYHYEGHTDGEAFFSTYKANFDHGTYTMERP